MVDKFARYNNPDHNKQFIGKEDDLFDKYRIFKNKEWVVGIKPTV